LIKIILNNNNPLMNLTTSNPFKKLNPKLLKFKYNNSKNCCLAPYTTINFDTMGYMRMCCYNNESILGTYPHVSIKDAWNNNKRKAFIKGITNAKYPKGCENCVRQIIENNTKNALFTDFDRHDSYINEDYPTAFSFDFGSICNYECIMCGGKWSSSIRKNREKLPPLKSPYDDNFLKQLEEFLPHLKVLTFLGGEPFLNSIYYKIWDRLVELNSNAVMSITTNGSIFNSKIKNYLLSLEHLFVNISLDSLNKDTYNFIRKNGNFDTVMSNFKEFHALGKVAGIAFCPMIQNVRELPDIIQFCIDNHIRLFLNDVGEHLGGKIKGIHEGEHENVLAWTGSNDTKETINVKLDNLIPEVALRTLPKKELRDIVSYLQQFSFEKTPYFQERYTSLCLKKDI